MTVCLIGGGSRSTRRKPPTCRKSLTNFITKRLYGVHLAMNGVRTHNLVIFTDCTCSIKSNYHTTTTTTAPLFIRTESTFRWWNIYKVLHEVRTTFSYGCYCRQYSRNCLPFGCTGVYLRFLSVYLTLDTSTINLLNFSKLMAFWFRQRKQAQC